MSKVRNCLNILDLPSAVINKGTEILLILVRPSEWGTFTFFLACSWVQHAKVYTDNRGFYSRFNILLRPRASQNFVHVNTSEINSEWNVLFSTLAKLPENRVGRIYKTASLAGFKIDAFSELHLNTLNPKRIF